MIDIGEVRRAFSDLTDITPLTGDSGQKVVLTAKLDGRDVCLKLIKPSGDDRERTAREIEAVARLRSKYVPEVLKHGARTIGGDDRLFVIEEFIPGATLRARLRNGPLSLADTIKLGDALVLACGDFEAHDLVHRDIKPENLMIDREGKIWVIDFGIARLLDKESLTNTSQRFGVFTPGYGAPEQMRNLKAQINTRADLFSVGVVMHECIVGRNPYLTGKADLLEVVRHMEREDLPKLDIAEDPDGELAEFIGALASRFPSRRPQTAKEAREWFGPIAARLATPRT
jgi:eukaryotic-like serine/threonine-protein kinase